VRVLPLSRVRLIRSLHASSLLTTCLKRRTGPKKRGSPPGVILSIGLLLNNCRVQTYENPPRVTTTGGN
jgi:hypothetical protein